MKKIVALVLSLVMVLGLATTAFAATTSTGSVSTTSVTPVKAALYDLADAGQSMKQVGKDFTEIKLTTVTGKIEKDVPMYVPNVYSLAYTYDDGTTTLTFTAAAPDLLMEVAKADAEYALKNDGKMIYLADINDTYNSDAIDTAVVIDSIVLPADDEIDCGDCYAGALPAAYYVSGEDVYYATGSDWAYFNGQFVKYDATTTVLFKAHEWDMDTVIVKDTDVKGVKVPVTVECKNCEKTFPVVSALAFDNTWVEFVDYQNFAQGNAYAGKYFVVLKAAATTTPDASTGDKVESAETFDAGIAMYVGMSVMAAAGSAVVLKKKD